MGETDRRCETCEWWEQDALHPGVPIRGEVMGECRIARPVNRWPKTSIRDWCGEHKPRESEERSDG